MKPQKQITVIIGAVIKQGKILMTQRFEPECPDAHLRWEIPGGKAEFGESAADAIKREIYEETGVRVAVEKLLDFQMSFIWNYADKEQQVLLFCFLCKYLGQEKVNPDHHVQAIDWIDLGKVKDLDTLPGANEIVDTLLNH